MDDYDYIANVKEKHLKGMKYATGGGVKYPDLSKQSDAEFLIQDTRLDKNYHFEPSDCQHTQSNVSQWQNKLA